MKNTILLFLIFLSCQLFAQIDTIGLVAYYPFNGNGNDSTRYANHATAYNVTLATDRFGVPNRAYSFNGTSSYLLAPAKPQIQLSSSFTLSVWVNVDASNTNQWAPIVEKRYNSLTDPYTSYSLYVGTPNTPSPFANKFFTGISNGISGTSKDAVARGNYAGGQWYFLTSVYDGQKNKIYINGVYDSSVAISGSINYTSLGLYFGYNSVGGQLYKGLMDDVTIYNRALTDCEIRKLYLNTTSAPVKSGFKVTNSYQQCLAKNSFHVVDTSTNSAYIVNRKWIFNPFEIDSVSNYTEYSTIPYTIPGNYTIKLVVTDSFGCMDTSSRTLTVINSAWASSGSSTLTQCLSGNNFDFYDNAYPTSIITKRLWRFGDGTQDTTPTVIKHKSYAQPGIYTVMFKVFDSNGCSDSMFYTVSVGNKPTPKLSLSTNTICESTPIKIIDSSYIANGALSSSITTGDGNNSNQSPFVYSYTKAGDYRIQLTTSNNGCSDTISKLITVLPKPHSGFTSNILFQCLKNNQFNLNDTTTKPSNLTMSRTWIFSDSTYSSFAQFSKSFLNSGTYTVKLAHQFSNGCSDTVSKTINVNPNTQIGFSSNSYSQCLKGNSFLLQDTSHLSNGFYSRIWDFGDLIQSTNPAVTKNYMAIGNYTVRLVTITSANCYDTAVKTIVVNPSPKMAWNYNSISQCSKNVNFEVIDTSTISNGTLSRQWIFNNQVSTTNPFHSYNTNVGFFPLKLVNTSDKGCSDTLSTVLEVKASPNAGFTINTPSQCLSGNSFICNDTSSIVSGTYSRVWYNGNNQVYTNSSITTYYPSSGNYTIKLMLSTNRGCSDSLLKTVTVYPGPKMGYTINNAVQCSGNNLFTLTDTSTISSGFISRVWKVNNQQSTRSPYSFNLLNPGNYTVVLYNTSDMNCKDSISIPLNVKPGVSTLIYTDAYSKCLGNSFLFVDSSIASSGSITSNWYVNNLAQTATDKMTYKPQSAGSFDVKLVSRLSNGCKDSSTLTMLCKPLPVADFSVNKYDQCLKNNLFVLIDKSTLSGGISSPVWRILDTITSSQSAFSQNFKTPGSYSIKLIAFGNNGCVDSVAKIVNVFASPQTSIISGDNVVSRFTTSSYMVNNTIGSSYAWSVSKGNYSGSGNQINITWLVPGTGKISVIETSDKGCVGDSVYKSILINDASGGIGEEMAKHPIYLYPNPATDECRIVNQLNEIEAIIIFDLNGKKVGEIKGINSRNISFSTADIPNGMYYINVISAGKTAGNMKLSIVH